MRTQERVVCVCVQGEGVYMCTGRGCDVCVCVCVCAVCLGWCRLVLSTTLSSLSRSVLPLHQNNCPHSLPALQ